MENNEFLKIRVKNRTCYYFDYIIKLEYFDSDKILSDKKSYGNILIYNISYKNLTGSKYFHFWFDKIDWFIRVYDGTRYLVLFWAGKYDCIYNRIRYLISKKDVSHMFFSRYHEKIKVYSSYSFPIKKACDSDQNHYNYNKFLEK